MIGTIGPLATQGIKLNYLVLKKNTRKLKDIMSLVNLFRGSFEFFDMNGIEWGTN
jgi:hypothetical protein